MYKVRGQLECLVPVSCMGLQSEFIIIVTILETCDAECQTEAKINSVDESQIIGEQNVTNEEDNLNIEVS